MNKHAVADSRRSWADYFPFLGNLVFVLSTVLFTLVTGGLWYLEDVLVGGEFGAGPTQVATILTAAMAVTSALALGSLLLGLLWQRWWSTRKLAEGSGGPLLVVIFFGWLGGVFFMMGLGLVSAGLHTAWQARNADHWQITQGTVLSHDVRSNAHDGDWSFTPQIRYTYQVAGERMESDSIYLGSIGRSYDSNSEARASMEAFPVGSTVDVHYDPARPQRSALRPESAGSEAIAITLGSIALFPGLFGLLLAGLYLGGIKVVRKPL